VPAEPQAIFQQPAEVVSVVQRAEGIYMIRLFADKIAAAARPGHFVEVRCGTDRDFILRRPFAVHAASGRTIDILFDVKGKATAALAQARVHDVFDTIGPLGRPFTIKGGTSRALLIAGGMGIAPLAFLAGELQSNHVRIYLALGATSKSRLPELMDLKRAAREMAVATDDGSLGERGVVTQVVPPLLHSSKPEMIYAAGPKAMLAEVARMVKPYDIPTEVSMEALMACGVGACLSCVVRTTEGLKRVCADGPVFPAEQVIWQW
jgi:dihydroorotate dehydrogenase electron transfer subunit